MYVNSPMLTLAARNASPNGMKTRSNAAYVIYIFINKGELFRRSPAQAAHNPPVSLQLHPWRGRSW